MWYVVYRGYECGVCGNTHTLHRRIDGYPNAMFHSYTTREQAERAWNKHNSKKVRLGTKHYQNLNMTSVPYDSMPRYKGSITPIPNILNSYQLIHHVNKDFNYVVYILYNHTEVKWFVRNIPQLEPMWVTLNGIAILGDILKNTNLTIPDYAISCAFEHSWINQWMREGTDLVYRDRWAYLYKLIYTNHINIIYHPELVHKDLVIALVEFEIFRKYFRVLEAHNKDAYYDLVDEYCTQVKVPLNKTLEIIQLDKKSSYH